MRSLLKISKPLFSKTCPRFWLSYAMLASLRLTSSELCIPWAHFFVAGAQLLKMNLQNLTSHWNSVVSCSFGRYSFAPGLHTAQIRILLAQSSADFVHVGSLSPLRHRSFCKLCTCWIALRSQPFGDFVGVETRSPVRRAHFHFARATPCRFAHVSCTPCTVLFHIISRMQLFADFVRVRSVISIRMVHI